MRLPEPFASLRPTRLPLALEITLALLLKLAILFLLWKLFFAAPPTRKMTLPTPQVEQHLLTATAPNTQTNSSLPPKAKDDSNR